MRIGPVLLWPRELAPQLDAPPTREIDGVPWLLRLRWGAVIGQTFALWAASAWLSLQLPWPLLFGCVWLTALTNAVLSLGWFVGPRTVPAVLVADILVLAAMLSAAGGASNPFAVFFLVHVALASLLLPRHAAWGVVGLTILVFSLLFALPMPSSIGYSRPSMGSTQFLGVWFAYALAAVFVAYFVTQVSMAIRDRDRRLAELRQLSIQNERLATLSSFSANAAHELGTPLATIGIAAKELAIAVTREHSLPEVQADTTLICTEVAHCREILAGLSARAGESVGEMPVRIRVAELVLDVTQAFEPSRVRGVAIHVLGDISSARQLVLPRQTFVQTLLNLVRNAAEAHEEAGTSEAVLVRVEVREQASFTVSDRGNGFAAELQGRIGEPFITTKSGSGGLGLGIYLARSFAERLGGALQIRSTPGCGSEVQLCLPLG